MGKLLALALIGILVLTTCSSTGAPGPSTEPAPSGTPGQSSPSTPTAAAATQTPAPAPSATPVPRYSPDEAISFVENYLLAQARTRGAQDIIQTAVANLKASYQGQGTWEVSGSGKWKLYEASGNVQPADDKARDVLKSIADANNPPPVEKTPTPAPTPTKETPTPSATPTVASAADKVSPAVVRVLTDQAMGSGIIIDKAGYVLTNSHVVEGSRTIRVILPDRREFTASILGRDELKDVAVLKISGPDLPVATLGKSSELKSGDTVIAVGYPLDLDGGATVSSGIVSAFRDDSEAGVTYIQTDAAINPGNSGGALINLKGEVIGVNTWVIRQSGKRIIEGINFAIAMDSIRPVIPSLMAGGPALPPTPSPSPSAVPAQPPTMYNNATWRYSVPVVQNWTVDDKEQDNVVIWSPGRVALVQIFADNEPGITLESFVDHKLSFRRSELPDFQEVSRSQLSLQGGIPAYSVVVKVGASGEPPSRAIFLLAVQGGRGFEVITKTWESAWDKYSKQFERMAYSIEIDRILEPNQPPVAVIESITPNPANEGAPVAFKGRGTDSDGRVVAYKWSIVGQGAIGLKDSFISPIAAGKPGTYTVVFQVQDDDGDWSPEVKQTLTVVAGWKTYISKTYGYSVQYPGDWKVNEEESDAIEIRGDFAGVFISTFPVSSENVDEFTDRNLRSWRTNNFYFQLVSDNKVGRQGLPGREIVYVSQREKDGTRWKDKHLIVASGDWTYAVQSWGAESRYDKFANQLDKIISSFTLTNPSQPWLTYTDGRYGYSIQYRADWTLNATNEKSVSLGPVSVFLSDPLGSGVSLSYLINSVVLSWLHQNYDKDGLYLISSRSITFQSREAWELVYTRRVSGNTFQYQSIILPTPRNLYEISASVSTTQPTVEIPAPEIDRALGSFRLTNP